MGSECAIRASDARMDFFGMEAPPRGSEGNAQCLNMDSKPKMDEKDDSDCEREVWRGYRLGNAFKLAVYTLQADYRDDDEGKGKGKGKDDDDEGKGKGKGKDDDD